MRLLERDLDEYKVVIRARQEESKRFEETVVEKETSGIRSYAEINSEDQPELWRAGAEVKKICQVSSNPFGKKIVARCRQE